MSKAQNKYVETVYNSTDRPFTTYPSQLAAYLFNRFNMSYNKTILEIGCGRGEFSKGFLDLGMDVHAVDQSDFVTGFAPGVKFKPCDLQAGLLPYEDKSFDFIYSKSVIEHFYYPEKIMNEIFRVLKPGGLSITMTPSWEENMHMFYEDYTHRTPFTPTSLRDIHLIAGFSHVHTEKFLQLPVVWKHGWMKPISTLTAWITPRFMKSYKFVRFSKEVMLLGHGTRSN